MKNLKTPGLNSMSRERKWRYFSADFETTVYGGQTYTEVWAGAIVELYTEDVKIFNSIDELYRYMQDLRCNMVVYFHNLKFDGNFWLSYLMNTLKYEQAVTHNSEHEFDIEWKSNKGMLNNTFKYSISNKGMWYTITIKTKNYIIELRDSLKLLPFSLKVIGSQFGTKHKKLTMDYVGFRYAGCEISDEEKQYIANDVLVLKEALEIMFNNGNNKLTIGACCLSEFKSNYDKDDYECLFPNLYEIPLDKEIYGAESAGKYILKSYRGGWCYLVPQKANKQHNNGLTADVNSLYPSVMHSESGSCYPIGKPKFWCGDYIPEEAHNGYFFIRIITRFKIKKNKLPFVQIKNSFLYKATEMLTTSNVYDKTTGKYYDHYTFDGKLKDTRVILTMTMTDYELLKEHYNLYEFEILDGCYFESMIGIFDDYINKYREIKTTAKTKAVRTLAKLFLNNLYGKMATTTDSSFKYAYIKPDQSIGFVDIKEEKKKPGYIAVGSAITSYARNFTIRAAQKNFYGANNRGFIYADTDSIHCDLSPEELVDIPVHSTAFCHWKLESFWDYAYFTRQKTYIEHITHDDGQPVEPYYDIKCAGMPDRSKQLFRASIEDLTVPNATEEELEFLKTKRTINDFKVGLKVPSKLMPKRIKGGVILVSTDYEMRA